MARIRAARPEDAAALREIEWLAGEQFRTVGLDFVADADPGSVEELAEYAAQGRGWVAVDTADEPVGYVIVDIVDGNAHIEQVSVRPDHQDTGVGRALIDRVRQWALETNRPSVTLTTFSEVPWNGPLYAHLGFTALAESEIGPELRAVRQVEADEGLDPAARVCMRLDSVRFAP